MPVTPASDPIDFLFSLERLGMKFGLEQISRLVTCLGHPECAFRSVHVAGTNGKGSVTAMVERALRAEGHRAARYTSPHLVRLEERFVVDGREVETAALRQAAARVREAVASLDGDPPTFFECTTAVAFELFRAAGVEIAVLEVGLGGRLDATNVVTPLVTAITSIDFDHQAQLGDTIEQIAAEKAGIVKPGVPLVCGPLPDAAARVIREIADRQAATVTWVPHDVRVIARGNGETSVVDVESNRRSIEGVRLALAGRHQIDNAAVAVGILDELDAAGVCASDAAVRTGLDSAEWPGRLERFTLLPDPGGQRGACDVLLDAAHNPAGARALASYLGELGWRGATLVVGAMGDKDVDGVLAALLPVCGAVVCTTPPNPRALPATSLAEAVRRLSDSGRRVEAIDDPAEALDRARALGPRVVAAGSIFLIGPLRDILR